MRKAAGLIVEAFGQQHMGVDTERPVVDCMASGNSGDRVARAMEQSAVMAVIGKLPEPQECWVALTYTDDHTDYDMGVVVRHVMSQSSRFGVFGQISVEDIVGTVEAITMMVGNAIGKTINGRERHPRVDVIKASGKDPKQFQAGKFWGRLWSAVDKATAELDCAALDAVDEMLVGRVRKGAAVNCGSGAHIRTSSNERSAATDC